MYIYDRRINQYKKKYKRKYVGRYRVRRYECVIGYQPTNSCYRLLIHNKCTNKFTKNNNKIIKIEFSTYWKSV